MGVMTDLKMRKHQRPQLGNPSQTTVRLGPLVGSLADNDGLGYDPDTEERLAFDAYLTDAEAAGIDDHSVLPRHDWDTSSWASRDDE